MRRKIPSFLLIMILLLSAAPVSYAGHGELDVWVVNSLKTVYRTSALPQNPVTSIQIVSAKNEYESSQIAVRGASDFKITKVQFSDLVSANRKSIASSNLQYHFEEYELPDTVQPNLFNPERVGEQIYPESDIPDPLSNEKSMKTAANSTQPIFITSYVPSSAEPGVYQGNVTIKTNRGDYTVPLQVEVANVEIPQTSEAHFMNYIWAMTNGFTWDGMQFGDASSNAFDVGQYYYGVKTYSNKWFKLMDNFAKVMTEYRQNMIWVRTDLFLKETGTNLSEFVNGIPDDIDWSLFDRYMQIFIDRGMKDFANAHLIHILNYMPASEKPDASWNTKLPDALPQTDAFLENYLTALHDHLVEKGWTKENGFTWYQHIRDEPIDDNATNYWTYIAKKVKQIVPDFKTVDADPNGILLNEKTKPYVDVWVPLTPAFQEKKDQYKAEQAAGQDLWVYTCEVNQPPWLNRFWTQPTLTGRLLYWNLFQDGVQGHLHWAWNAWYVGSWYGDSTIVYPDTKNMTVKSSVRYEAQRDGLEEYELLYKIKETRPELAAQIADLAVSPEDARKYTLSPDYVKSLHDYMVRAAAGEQAGDIPIPESPYDGQEMPLTYMVDNSSGDLTYTGNWFDKSRQYAYQGGVRVTETANDAVEYEFEGTGIDVVVEKNDSAGKVAISIDDAEPVIVDAYEKVQHDYFTIYHDRNLSQGRHKIKVVNMGNKSLHFDAFRVQMYDGQQTYDASLSSIMIDPLPSFQFDSGIREYKILLPEDVNAVTVTPKQKDGNGTMLINGKPIAAGEAGTANIPDGKSRITILSMASDGKTTKEYTLSLIKGNNNEPGSNAARTYSSITATAARTGDQGVTYGPQKMADGDYGTMFASPQGYNDTHPFPHEIVVTWDQPQSFNTIVMATTSGLLQGINDMDVQISSDGTNFETVSRHVPVEWRSDKDDNVMEKTYASIPDVSQVRKLKIIINDADFRTWNMYALYELELYQLPDHGELDLQITDGA
ncbi:hypothetical protein J23TS9_30410 [Paenibacillus sp. J23TS9]|uniref:glycoside hydrolase domain-containing protein n=1 Tax=Paenibacillus sp. J23TS9 TaxID=2807193 RepID=UPI001B0F0101|nr:glycoside hydrolase domain-containing protein [Paenibacillus sp. J23TS9]GIP27911.1 hypothetical protein J23TS9_30410 [Paenibacillus sp. J23TS9]